MTRTYEGEMIRRDSVAEIVALCRKRYDTDDVRCVSKKNGEFVVRVRRRPGREFESLIVHLEGERVYAVLLPPADANANPPPPASEPSAEKSENRRPWWRFRR